MTSHRTRWLLPTALLAVFASLTLLGACAEEDPVPSEPDSPPSSFYHGDGSLDDGTADDVKIIESNLSGEGSEVCNDPAVKDENVVGDDEDVWSGKKVDPPEDDTDNGFTVDVKGKKSLDWDETEDGQNLMQAVLIKAGSSSVVYYYNEGDPESEPDPVEDHSDSKLDGEDNKEISHYVYCFVPQPAVKKGVKFDDANADGEKQSGEAALNGWEISVYADVGSVDGELDSADEFVADTMTGEGALEDGAYEFILQPGDYIVCEEERSGWNQSLPANNDVCAAGSGVAEDGYAVTLEAAEMDEDNDFGNTQSTIEVTVEDGDGYVVEGRRVVAVHSENGPYRNGVLRSAVTDANGLAVIGNLEPGEYCVRTTPIADPPGKLVPPDDPDDAPTFSDDFGTAVSVNANGGITSEKLTLGNFEDGCLADPPLSPGDAVTLTLQGKVGDLTGEFESLDGDNQEISAWMVANVGSLLGDFGVRTTWIDNLPSDLKDRVQDGKAKIGLLVTAAVDEGTPSFTAGTPGGPLAIESDLVPVGETVETASASANGTGDVGTIPTEPQWCVLNTLEEDPDDGDEVELKGLYKHGFLATVDLNLIETAWGVSYVQEGAGDAKLKVRAEGKGTKRLVADYHCDSDGNCDIDKLSGSLAKKAEVTLGSAGGNRVRWILTSLPKNLEAIESGVSTPGDAIPDASRDDNNDGLTRTSLPTDCKTSGSRWLIGGD